MLRDLWAGWDLLEFRVVAPGAARQEGGAMIDHVTANVSDFERAKRFYEQALAPLGYSLRMEFEGAAGFGIGDGMPDFWLGSRPERGSTSARKGLRAAREEFRPDLIHSHNLPDSLAAIALELFAGDVPVVDGSPCRAEDRAVADP